MIIKEYKMYYLSDYELGAIENDTSLPEDGIKVLVYNKGEFIGGAIYASDIPPFLLIEALDMYPQIVELDKITVILQDGRKVSKKF